MLTYQLNHAALLKLQATIQGAVITPDDPSYDDARQNWNVAVDQHPAVIVIVATASDIVQAVHFANVNNLKIAVKSTGHGVYAPADDCLLVVTSNMKDVQIDIASQTARIEAGAKWINVLTPAQQVGLAPLLSSSPYVGVVGYTLGGGMGWLARKYGLATDSVTNFELVTPNGQQVSANETKNSDLYWALRGGGGNFGVVAALTIRLYPVTTVYAGNLYYPLNLAREVYARYREWVKHAPIELTSGVTIFNYPPLPDLPDVLRGQSYIQVRGCYVGSTEDGEKLLSFWRNWHAPIVDDFRARPFIEAEKISNDPVDPMPAFSTSVWLCEINDDVIETLARACEVADGPPMLIFAEIRHAGGAIAQSQYAETAFSRRDGAFSLQLVGVTPTHEAHTALVQYTDAIKQGVASALTGGVYMNWVEGEEGRRRSPDGFSPEAYARLQSLKNRLDPDNRFDYSFNLTAK